MRTLVNFEEKGVLGAVLGRAIGASSTGRNAVSGGGKRGKRGTRKVRRVRFDPKAPDRDGDGLVQEGTNQQRRAGQAMRRGSPSSRAGQAMDRLANPLPPRKRPTNPAKPAATAPRRVRADVAPAEPAAPRVRRSSTRPDVVNPGAALPPRKRRVTPDAPVAAIPKKPKPVPKQRVVKDPAKFPKKVREDNVPVVFGFDGKTPRAASLDYDAFGPIGKGVIDKQVQGHVDHVLDDVEMDSTIDLANAHTKIQARIQELRNNDVALLNTIRDPKSVGTPRALAKAQVEYVANQRAVKRLADLDDELDVRSKGLSAEFSLSRNMDMFEDGSLDDFDRILALNAAGSVAGRAQTTLASRRPNIPTEAYDQLEKAMQDYDKRRLAQQDLINEMRGRVEGPKDLGSINKTFPQYGKAQTSVDNLVSLLNGNPSDDDFTKVATEIGRLRAEKAKYGAEKDVFYEPAANREKTRDENVYRRWLELNLNSLEEASTAHESTLRAKKVVQAFPKYKPAKGDLSNDETVLNALANKTFPFDPNQGSSELQYAYSLQGFDGPTHAVEETDLDNLIKLGGIETTRNVDDYTPDNALLNALRTGKYYAGYGIYGNGTYTSPDKSVTSGYGNTRVRMVISADAKMIDYDEVRAMQTRETDTRLRRLNAGTYAVLKGYDVVRETHGRNDPGRYYYVLLNRTVASIGPVLTGTKATEYS